jgi:hypothetical protein
MAISTGTELRAYAFEELRDSTYTATSEYEVLTCKVDVEFKTVAYADGNDATFVPATIIQNTLRDGQTVTILQAAVVAGGVYALAAAPTTPVLVGAGACTNAAGTITVPLLAEDWTTEIGTVALDTSKWAIPLTFQVTFKRPRLS